MARYPVQDLAQAVESNDHTVGPTHAPVVVVEYGDFECPACKQAAACRKLLLQRFPNRVLFAYRHFPLEPGHPHALGAAEAAECAAQQGKFWEMHDLLFENQERLASRHLSSYAQALGLDMALFTAEMDDHVYLQRIREHQQGGRRSHLHSTPGFFVNGRIQDVSFGLHGLIDAVAAAAAARFPRPGSP